MGAHHRLNYSQRKTILLMVMYALLSQSVVSQSLTEEQSGKVDKLFAFCNKPNIPGAVVVVVKDGKPLLVRGYGAAELAHNLMASPATLYNAASLAKQFTAFAILLLESEGKLSLSNKVRSILPEFPEVGKTITIRHLLYHTSGLRDYGGLLQMSGGRMDDAFSSWNVIDLLSRQEDLNFAPGTEFCYCNAGYVVLAEIVARVSGKSFREFTGQHIFVPLKMESTYFRDNLSLDDSSVVPSYTRTADGRYTIIPDSSTVIGPGSLFISAEDMTRWMTAFQLKSFKPNVWTKLSVAGTLDDGTPLRFASGLILGSHKGIPILHHSGGWAGYRGETVYFPDQQLAVAVLTNNSTIDPKLLSKSVADLFLDPARTNKPPQAAAAALDSVLLDRYTGQYWLMGDRILTITRKANRLIAQVTGQMALELFPESETSFSYRIVDARIEFPRSTIEKITFWQETYAMAAEKITADSRVQSDLSGYCGNYFSKELGMNLEVKLNEKGLVIPFQRRSNLQLVPVAADRFAGRESSTKFRFVRTPDGTISALLFSMLDAWNVEFVKTGPGSRK